MGPRMKIYTVHLKPGVRESALQPVFLREGFNFNAFLFTFFWAVYHRLWLPAAAMFFFNGIVMELEAAGVISFDSTLVIMLGYQFLVGMHANDWLRRRMERKGWLLADLACADSLLGAQQRFFDRFLAGAARTA